MSWKPQYGSTADWQPPLPFDVDAPLSPDSADQQSRALLDQVRQRRLQRQKAQHPPEDDVECKTEDKERGKKSLLHSSLARTSESDARPAIVLTPASQSTSAKTSSAQQPSPSDASPLSTGHSSSLPQSSKPRNTAENQYQHSLARHDSLDSTDIHELTRSGTIKLVLPPGQLVDGLDLDFTAPGLLQRHGVHSVSQSSSVDPLTLARTTSSKSLQVKEAEQLRGRAHSAPPPASHDTLSTSGGSRTASGGSHPSDLFSPKVASASSIGGSDGLAHSDSIPSSSSQPLMALVEDMPHQVKEERDILDILKDMAEARDRQREASRADTGRRTYIGQAVDINGDPFDTVNTSLSPIEERTERSTRSAVSSISTFRDSLASRHGLLTSPERRMSQQSALSTRTSRSQPQPPLQQPVSNRSSRILSPNFEQNSHRPPTVSEEDELQQANLPEQRPATPENQTAHRQVASPPPLSAKSQKSASELIKLFDARGQGEAPPSPSKSPRKTPQRKQHFVRPQTPESIGSLRPREIPSLQEWVNSVDAEAKRRHEERRRKSSKEEPPPESQAPSRSTSIPTTTKTDKPVSAPPLSRQETAKTMLTASQTSTLPEERPQMRARATPSRGSSLHPATHSDFSTTETNLTLSSNADVLHQGDLLYSPPTALTASGRFTWRRARAVLIEGSLLMAVRDDEAGHYEDKRLRLARCTKVESVRLPYSSFGGEDIHRQHAFRLEWTNGNVEHFACSRATERVLWISKILDVLSFSSCATSLTEQPDEEELLPSETDIQEQDRRPFDGDRTPQPEPAQSTTPQLSRQTSRRQLPPDELDRLLADVERMTTFSSTADEAEQGERRYSPSSGGSSIVIPPSRSNAPLPPLPTQFDPLGYAPSSSSSAPALQPGNLYQGSQSSVSSDTMQRYRLQDPGYSPASSRLLAPLSPRASMRRRALAQQALTKQKWSPRRRGAWSDPDRKSIQSEAALLGPASSRALARDMRRLLSSLEHKESAAFAESDQMHAHILDIEHQLMGIQTRLKGHEDDLYDSDNLSNADPDQPVPNLADKVDYMIKLSQILKESQDKVSSAVEQQLRKEGVTVEAQSSPSELGSEGSALQQAGLGRIEDLLGAILSRLETGEQAMPEMLHEPRLPPHQEQPEQDSPAENVQFSSKSVSTVSEGELLALRDKPSYQPKSRDISAQSSPRSEGYIVKERKKTMEKLQSVRSPSDLHSQNPRANENSHWSADTVNPSNQNSSGQHGSNLSVPTPQAQNVQQSSAEPSTGTTSHIPPTPTPSKDPAFATPMFYDSSTQSDPSLAASAPMGPDPETMGMLRNILQSMQEQTQITNANTSYQREVGEYLNRFDDYLRREAANRKQDWKSMHDNLAQLERKVSQLAKTKRRDSRTSLRSKIDRSTDGGPAVSRGASLLRKASFRRSEDQEPATETDQEPPQPQPRGPRKPSALPGGKRKRSLSLPKFGGENKIRIWGAPDPTGNSDPIFGVKPIVFNRRPSSKKNSAPPGGGPRTVEDDLTAGTKFDTLEAALASYGGSEKPEGLKAPSGPRMPGPPPRSQSQQSLGKDPPPQFEGREEESEDDDDGDKPTPKGILAAMKGFMSQLMDHQKREEEREKLAEARYQELLTRTAEPSPAVAPDTSSLTEERERSDEMLRELISQLKEKTAEHDNMLREVMDAVSNQAPANVVNSPSEEDTQALLEALKNGVNVQINEFKNNMSAEVKQALQDVTTLRDQKMGLQHEIAELMSFKARNARGAPEAHSGNAQAALPHPARHQGPLPPKKIFGGTFTLPGHPGSGQAPPPSGENPGPGGGGTQESGKASKMGAFGNAFGPRAPIRT